MKICEFVWTRNTIDDEWEFHYYVDDILKDPACIKCGGFIRQISPLKITGSCRYKNLNEWKWRSIEAYKNYLNNKLLEHKKILDSLPIN